MGVGSKIVPSDINSVFSRLEALRVKHYNGAGQTSAGKNALSTAFTTNVVNSNEEAVEKYSLMKQYLNTLRNSTFLTSLTTSTIDTITTPQAGDLISFANLEVASSVVTEVESMPFTNGSNFSGFHSNCFNFDGTDFSCFSFHPNGTARRPPIFLGLILQIFPHSVQNVLILFVGVLVVLVVVQ